MDCRVGGIIKFGRYNWRVLDVRDGKALLLSEKTLERKKYHSSEYHKSPTDVTWENCTLREYLNGKFYNKFSGRNKERIAETQNQNSDNLWYGTRGGNPTKDKVFLLSLEEADKYFGDSGDYLNKRRKRYDDNGKWVANSRGYTVTNRYDKIRMSSLWWLRSSGEDGSLAAFVDSSGKIYVKGFNVLDVGGVRPALWINL